MYDVITIGSATVDAFVGTGDKLFHCKGSVCKVPFGTKIVVDDLHFDTGGSGTNTAVAFSRMGLKTAWLGKIGKGTNSQRILKLLKKEKIDGSLVCSDNGRTGFSVILDAKGHDRTILAFKGSNDDLSEKEVKWNKINAKWIYMGSMVGKSLKTALKVIKFAKKKGSKVAFNPSSYLTRKGRKGINDFLKITDLLVLNKEEAENLVGKKKIGDILKSLKKCVEGSVVVTDGKRGAYAYDGKDCFFVKPGNVKIVETTGAGDSFAAGFLVGLIKEKNLKSALILGQKEAESVIMHYGAKNKLLTWKEAQKIRARKVTQRRI